MYLMGTNFDMGGIISLLISDEGVEEPGMEPYMECVINEVPVPRRQEQEQMNTIIVIIMHKGVQPCSSCLPGNRYIWFPR